MLKRRSLYGHLLLQLAVLGLFKKVKVLEFKAHIITDQSINIAIQ